MAEERWLNKERHMIIEKNNTSYRLIEDLQEYVRTCLATGNKVLRAYKNTPVLARIAVIEEEIDIFINLTNPSCAPSQGQLT